MTHKNQFNSFIVSRFFSGFFGGVTGVLGPRVLVDLFFLHQRGRAFTAFHWCLNFGSVAGPTLSAYISSNRSWTLEFWWTVGLLGFTIICCLLFMHETSWVREADAVNSPAPENFFANRIATFFPGTKVTPKSTARQTVRTPSPKICHKVQRLMRIPGSYCSNPIPRPCFPCYVDYECLHIDQLWVLHCHECPHSCVPPEASEDRRIWIQHNGQCKL